MTKADCESSRLILFTIYYTIRGFCISGSLPFVSCYYSSPTNPVPKKLFSPDRYNVCSNMTRHNY